MKSIERVLLLKFPRFGLGNKLITWAKAYIWSINNHAQLKVGGWSHIPFGSILRGDKNWRLYFGFFKNKNSCFLFSKFRNKNRIIISNIADKPQKCFKFYQFEASAYISDLKQLMDYREAILSEFLSMTKEKHLNKAKSIDNPIVGVHIRRGDSVKNGSVVNLSYYTDVINKLRTINKNLPVTIFSDGYEHELSPVLDLPNVQLFKSVNDLVDLLVLSKSRILVTNLGSSYSYWAAFISDGIIIHHPQSWVSQCRPPSINTRVFEGSIPETEDCPEQLINDIKGIII
jgi:hypothetical protein